MTEIREIYCQNCICETECTEVTDPDGESYWVCEGCSGYVEEGSAMCVVHRKTT